jgi:hypothetical protein
MCDERERLIGFLYEEGDPRERAEVEAHVAQCGTCRHEIDALRSVRQDLLAWSVPEHDPVWRPTAPARPVPTWRDVPGWALAAAAAVVIMAGVSGALVSRLLLPGTPRSVAASDAAAASVTTTTIAPSAVGPDARTFATRQELEAVEQRLRGELQADLDRVEVMVSHQPAGSARTLTTALDRSALEDIRRRVEQVERLQSTQIDFNLALDAKIGRALGAWSDGNPSVVRAGYTR